MDFGPWEFNSPSAHHFFNIDTHFLVGVFILKHILTRVAVYDKVVCRLKWQDSIPREAEKGVITSARGGKERSCNVKDEQIRWI